MLKRNIFWTMGLEEKKCEYACTHLSLSPFYLPQSADAGSRSRWFSSSSCYRKHNFFRYSFVELISLESVDDERRHSLEWSGVGLMETKHTFFFRVVVLLHQRPPLFLCGRCDLHWLQKGGRERKNVFRCVGRKRYPPRACLFER